MSIRNALVGYLLGDAYGAPYEFDTEDGATAGLNTHFRELRPSVFGHAPGRGTDDTELLLASGRAVTDPYWEASSQRELWLGQLFGWQDTGPLDIGTSTRASLDEWRRGVDPRATLEGQRRAGNGALILATAPALAGLWPVEVAQLAALTHPAPAATRAAALYAELLRAGELPEVDLEWLCEEGARGGEGYAPKTLLIAWQALRSVREGRNGLAALEDVIRLGGDTDTNAAIAGALIGQHGGTDWDSGVRDQLDKRRLVEVFELSNLLAER